MFNEMDELDQPFDPKKTTLKDYMKYLIEQVEELKKEQQKTQEKVTRLEYDMSKRNILNDQKQKHMSGVWAIIGVIGGVVGFLIDLIIRTLSE